MYTEIIKDSVGNDYVAIDVMPAQVDSNGITLLSLLKQAEDVIPDFDVCNQKLLRRNHGAYHITVYNSMEWKAKQRPNSVNMSVKDVVFHGIGSISKDGMTTYFVVINSPELQAIRTINGDTERDYHITIGYTDKDLFHDRKNATNVLTL